MQVSDIVYGNFDITDPLVLELLGTRAFDRLRGVSQYGLPSRYYPSYPPASRFEHCLGVYILLNKLNASRKEQIAGLLHDVSHTAFSHLIDWVVGADVSKEGYQDSVHLSVLSKPEIAGVLGKYGYTPEGMADYHAYRLLESGIPDLCADRIDYSLRQMPEDGAKRYLGALAVSEDRIIFSDRLSAAGFARSFLKLQVESWAGYDAATRYNILSGIFRKAIAAGDLALTDFETEDEYVLSKLAASGKREYADGLKILESRDLGCLPKDEEPSFRKFRYVDPVFSEDRGLLRLSDVDADFKKRLEEAQKKNAVGIFAGHLP
jgi:uncharacterized protein